MANRTNARPIWRPGVAVPPEKDVKDKLTYKIALKRTAIDAMDSLELRALASFCKRLFKDIKFPWKRITLMAMSVETRERMGEPLTTTTIRVPGMRFGCLFIHQDRDVREIYAISHFATGRRITSAASLLEAAYICAALEFGGVPWDLIHDIGGFERLRQLPHIEDTLALIKRAFGDLMCNEAVEHDRMPHAELRRLVDQADALRAVLEISQPNQILLLGGLDGGDTAVVVTADGLGGADYAEFADYDAGPDNRQQIVHRHFETEAAATEHARMRISVAEDGQEALAEFEAPV